MSLLELMAVLMILGLLTTIAIPSMSTLWRRYNLRTAAEDLVYAAELCRGRARANRRAYGLVIGTASGAKRPLKIHVLRGKTPNCSSLDKTPIKTFDYGPGNAKGEPEVHVVAVAPRELWKVQGA